MKKRPKSKINPPITKKPRRAPQNSPESILSQRPSWRLGRVDLNGPWGWNNVQSKDKLIDIMKKLGNFESMTWGEIDRSGNSHIMPLDEIEKEARERLKERELDDQELYSFRLSAKERIWGIREIDAFYIIWWDPEHTIYPVQKKHT